jgi:hypothetical protein
MSKPLAIIAIIMTSAGIIGGAWVGTLLAGWIGAMLFFPFGGGAGYLIGTKPGTIAEFLREFLSLPLLSGSVVKSARRRGSISVSHTSFADLDCHKIRAT